MYTCMEKRFLASLWPMVYAVLVCFVQRGSSLSTDAPSSMTSTPHTRNAFFGFWLALSASVECTAPSNLGADLVNGGMHGI